MARDIPGTSGNYLGLGSDVAALDITGSQLSISAWVYPDSLTAFTSYVSKWNNPNTNNQYMLRLGNPSNKLEMLIGDGGSGFSWAEVTAMTTGEWQHIGGVVRGTGAGDLRVYRNGSLGGTQSGGVIGNASSLFSIGAHGDNANHCDAKIAEVGVWNIGLTDDEMAALGKGFSPAMIRPQNLVGYWPLRGNASPEPDLRNGNNLTVFGSVPKVDHPRIIVPRPAIYVP